ncbi:MAG TPA: threonine--tRNA ligase [Rectinemataceae bacterium]|nr:threonine--tRNA ligase [Rectinemataceae bacterium]
MASDVELIRHSAAHVMAEAVLKLYPGTKLGIGPAIDDGFYYDFALPSPIQSEDLGAIEKEMRRIIATGAQFVRREISKEEARKLFADQPFKVELIEGLEDGSISTYEQDGFVDLCRGPHVQTTREIRPDAFKLRSIAGAYWRGDEKRPMLTRIYALAFASKADLEAHLKMLEEAERRDHRKLGRELDLFSTHEEAGPGLVYWHPNGGRFRVELENWWREEHYRNGYDILFTPHIGKAWLWETSGHLGFYKGNMYSPMKIDENDYYAKPMNCPFHIMIYKSRVRSYRDLPLRWAELGTVYRYERSGVLHGLMRVRGFTQDDAHIICTPEQIQDEVVEVLRFSLHMWRTLGFKDIKAYLATKPTEGAIGEDSRWETAIGLLKQGIEKEGLPYEIDEGGGAFYGPKIDLKIKDAIGREWQMTTIQFDWNEPARFDMTYVDKDGQQKQPYMVHRALLGSLERFFGVFIEHYAGAFPVWLCPVQAVVIPVAPAFDEYAATVVAELRLSGIRAEAMLSDERMNAKIRDAQNRKIPYMLVVGQKEADGAAVSVRHLSGTQENGIPLADFKSRVLDKIATKAIEA